LSEFVVFFDPLAQTLPRRQDFLGSFLVLPEIMLGYLFIEGFKFFAALRGVKESSAVRWCVALSRHILFAVRRSRLLLISQWRHATTDYRRGKIAAPRTITTARPAHSHAKTSPRLV
jgi:hypothetical protein